MADYYVDVQNGNDANTGMQNSPWKTIGHSVDELLKIADGTSSHKVSVLPGVYREAITIPPEFSFNNVEFIAGNASNHIITGADIVDNDWDDAWSDNSQGSGIYKNTLWKYQFDPSHLDTIKTHRCLLRTQLSNAFEEHFGIYKDNRSDEWILHDFSERLLLSLDPMNQFAGIGPANILREVFRLEDLRDYCFFVNHASATAPMLTCEEPKGPDPNGDSTPANDCTVYVKLGAGEKPGDRQIEAATRAFVLRVDAPNVVFKGFTFRAAAGTEVRAAIDLQGNNARLENCLVEWNTGQGIKIQGNDCVLKQNIVRNNGQQGITGFGANNGALINSQTNGNSYRWWSIRNELPKMFPGARHLGGFGEGGLVVKKATGWIVVNHTSQGNIGNGIWFDHAGDQDTLHHHRIIGGSCSENTAAGINLEVVNEVEVANVMVKDNGVGMNVRAKRSFIHHNVVIGNNHYGISINDIGWAKDKLPQEADPIWLYNNTIANHTRANI